MPLVHEIFEFEHWLRVFSNASIQEVVEHSRGGHITSPVDVVISERLRARHQHELSALNNVPSDIFIFGLGEPKHPASTKVGGMPYRSAKRPWPVCDGQPYTFVAQFNFQDSRDIVGSTPGDVLLIYAMQEDFCNLYFEWSNSDIEEEDLQVECPDPGFIVVNCYGQRFRTNDFDVHSLNIPRAVAIQTAIKIGGLPPFNGRYLNCGEEDLGEDDEDDLDEDDLDEDEKNEFSRDVTQFASGRYICTLGPVQFNCRFEFPWVNHPERLSVKGSVDPKSSLILVDLGKLMVFIENDGTVNFLFETS